MNNLLKYGETPDKGNRHRRKKGSTFGGGVQEAEACLITHSTLSAETAVCSVEKGTLTNSGEKRKKARLGDEHGGKKWR